MNIALTPNFKENLYRKVMSGESELLPFFLSCSGCDPKEKCISFQSTGYKIADSNLHLEFLNLIGRKPLVIIQLKLAEIQLKFA